MNDTRETWEGGGKRIGRKSAVLQFSAWWPGHSSVKLNEYMAAGASQALALLAVLRGKA